jgi:glycosyltransferase involved in cell wall biosynthesis
MKFVVEALGLVAAGGKQLCLDFLTHLPEHSDHQFIPLLPNLPEYGNVSRRNLKPVSYRSASLFRRYVVLNRDIPKICLQERADALLCLSNFPPRRLPCPAVVLLHNAYIAYRDPIAERRLTLRERLLIAYGRRAFQRLAPQVGIIVQTRVIRDRLLSVYNLDHRRVNIVSNSHSLPIDTDANLGRLTFGPTQTFNFLCLTRYYAHKNIEILVEAVNRLTASTGRAVKCIITISAKQHPGARKLLKRIAREGLEHVLVNIGPVPHGRLAEVYRSDDALVLPTLLESFTRTYLEAMYLGVPILTSDRDFAHQVCQDAAVYFDPLDADSVANAMARVMDDVKLRHQLVSDGKNLVKQSPSWDEIAARIISVLECAARGFPLEPLEPIAEVAISAGES